MSLNLKNLTIGNLRLKLVPREGSAIELGEGNENPTAFIDTDGSLNVCLGKQIFYCRGVSYLRNQTRPVGDRYYYDFGQPGQLFALTAVTESPTGIETVTARWVWEDHPYSDPAVERAFGSAVVMDTGNGPAHFQTRESAIYTSDEGVLMENPDEWVIVTFIPTPDLAEGEVDYVTQCMVPTTGENFQIVACQRYTFPGF